MELEEALFSHEQTQGWTDEAVPQTQCVLQWRLACPGPFPRIALPSEPPPRSSREVTTSWAILEIKDALSSNTKSFLPEFLTLGEWNLKGHLSHLPLRRGSFSDIPKESKDNKENGFLLKHPAPRNFFLLPYLKQEAVILCRIIGEKHQPSPLCSDLTRGVGGSQCIESLPSVPIPLWCLHMVPEK